MLARPHSPAGRSRPGAGTSSGPTCHVPARASGAVDVGTHAFERLMARWYAAILESVALQRLPVVDEPWWPQLTTNVAALTDRVAARQVAPAQG